MIIRKRCNWLASKKTAMNTNVINNHSNKNSMIRSNVNQKEANVGTNNGKHIQGNHRRKNQYCFKHKTNEVSQIVPSDQH